MSVAAIGIGAYIRSQQDSGSSTLNPLTFTKYTLISKDPVSSTGSIFTFKPPKPDGNEEAYERAWRTGVWSVMFKQPQLQIGRDYTPLPVTSTTGSEDDDVLRFFIRRDPFGEVSRYLHGLDLGSKVEMRGPKIERRIPPRTREVLFIAGGTALRRLYRRDIRFCAARMIRKSRGYIYCGQIGDERIVRVVWMIPLRTPRPRGLGSLVFSNHNQQPGQRKGIQLLHRVWFVS